MKNKKFCIICRKSISKGSMKGRCSSCAMKERFKDPKNHPRGMKGKTLSKKSRQKLRQALKGQKRSLIQRKRISLGTKKGMTKEILDKLSQLQKQGWGKKSVKRKVIGKNHWNWQGGIGSLKYSSIFTQSLKYKIRARDCFKCQLCGMLENKYYRKLDVHHIDYNKQNCKNKNLITLCHKCNTQVNWSRDYWYAYFKYILENK